MMAKQSEEYLFHQCCKKTATNRQTDIIANKMFKKFKHNNYYNNKIFVCVIFFRLENDTP